MNRWIFVGIVTLVTGVLLTVLVRPASADRPFDLRSLKGTYIGGLVEVRLPPVGTEPVEYCDSSGTFTFDGAGGGASNLTRRCSIEGTVTDVLTFTYSVSPDGSGDLLFSSGEGGRFRLAQGGQLAFISAVGDFDASVLVHNGVFARR